MLKKLLKYDFKSVLKYWWIAALSSFVLAFAGGWCLSIMNSEKELPTMLYPLAAFAMMISILSFVVFVIISYIAIFGRFYKNFFTDEGYLTFTLPVTRAQLLNSKLITSVATLTLTTLIVILEVLTLLCVGFSDIVFTPGFWQEIEKGFSLLWDVLGGYLIVYIVEFLVILILLFAFSTLFIFCCVTFASIITKKAKVVTAIGIYYAANSIFSFVLQMFYLFGLASLMEMANNLPVEQVPLVIALILLGIICFISIFCSMLYALQYWMMDRKLNLS